MGTDIHPLIEVYTGDEWMLVGPRAQWPEWDGTPGWRPYRDRNYELFTILSGVRGRFALAPLMTPGFPDNPSREIMMLVENHAYRAERPDAPYSVVARGMPHRFTDDEGNVISNLAHIDLGDHDFGHCTLHTLATHDWSRTWFYDSHTKKVFNHAHWCTEFVKATIPDLIGLAEELGVSWDHMRMVVGYDS